MKKPHELHELQAWFQTAVRSSSSGEAEPLPAQIAAVITPSAQMSSAERLTIYQQSYAARLVECLRATFPTVTKVIGEEAMDGLALGYLQAYPSRSYTLNDLGRAFPAYLEATRPTTDAQVAAWFEFVVDLAILDAAIDDVFDGPGDELETPADWNQLRELPAEAWADLRLLLGRSVRLLAFRFPVNDVFSAVRQGELPAPPEHAPTWLALCRTNWIVRRHPLSAAEFALLSQLQQGARLGAAIVYSQLPPESLSDCFAHWTAAGILGAPCR